MTDVEDEIPPGQAKVLRRPRRRIVFREKVAWVVGCVGFAALALGAAHSALNLQQERSTYLASPVCTIAASDTGSSAAAACPARDRIDETVTVGPITVASRLKNGDVGMLSVDFTDLSGTVGDPNADFSKHQPPLDPTADKGRALEAEVYQGTLMWLAVDGQQYQADASVAGRTSGLAGGLAAIVGVYLLFSCFAWWLLVRRGMVAGQGAYRPTLLLAALVTGVTGYLMLTRYEAAGVAVVLVAMVLATLLGLPPMPGLRERVPPPSSWPRLARTRWSGRRGTRGHDEIFR